MNIEKEYLKLANRVLSEGVLKPNRTGISAYDIFGATLSHDFINGFPLLRTKKINFKAIKAELLWFLRGGTNVKDLNADNVHIWDAWADKNGEVGPIYGKQWTSWGPNSINQIRSNVLDTLKSDPNSRRALVSAWNVDDLDKMALPPCPVLWQVSLRPASKKDMIRYISEQFSFLSKNNFSAYAYTQKRDIKYFLDLSIYQRSADLFLGLPFDLASYGLIMLLLCNELDAMPGQMFWSSGSTHLYSNHKDQIKLQLKRDLLDDNFPIVHIDKLATVDNVQFCDIDLYNYNPYPPIKGDIAI